MTSNRDFCRLSFTSRLGVTPKIPESFKLTEHEMLTQIVEIRHCSMQWIADEIHVAVNNLRRVYRSRDYKLQRRNFLKLYRYYRSVIHDNKL